MVLFDIAIFGGLVYSILGNVIRYYKNKECVDNSIEKTDGETDIIRIQNEKNGDKNGENLLYILKNNEKNICLKQGSVTDILYDDDTVYKNIYYINRVNHLNKFITKNNLNEFMFPVSLPLKIYKKRVSIPVYYTNSGYDINRKVLHRVTMFDKRLPLSLSILTFSSVITIGSWVKYVDRLNYSSYPEYVDKPIFHPKRYFR